MLRQHLTLTPQLQQALRLLQLSSLEFEQEMREALDTNPFLEGGGCGARGCRDTMRVPSVRLKGERKR